jgi:hypothetical protein
MTFSLNLGNLGNVVDVGSWGSHSGSAPEPFDALNGPTLAGGQGSHPLHGVRAEDLVRPSDGPVTAEWTFTGPAMVGDGINGTVKLAASERVEGRGAILRLVGLRLDEQHKSREEHNAKGEVTRSESWIEANGQLFAQDGFMEPAIPATLEAGQTWSATFSIPAPRLGPPSAHLGEAIVAWALEVRWDVPHGSDHFVATYLPIAQHPDLLRAGVGKQGGQSMLADVGVKDGHIAVTSPMPTPAGTDMVVRVNWPSARGGDQARIELHRRTNAPNGVEGIIATVAVASSQLVDGSAEVRLTVPAGAAPSFDGAGLEVSYILRALVDRRFRPDAAIERPVAIA